jgi:hypothetical protein
VLVARSRPIAPRWRIARRRSVQHITNGDYFRWQNLWPKIAAAFDMPAGEVRTARLAADMADKAPFWRAMTEKYGLSQREDSETPCLGADLSLEPERARQERG